MICSGFFIFICGDKWRFNVSSTSTLHVNDVIDITSEMDILSINMIYHFRLQTHVYVLSLFEYHAIRLVVFNTILVKTSSIGRTVHIAFFTFIYASN